jgi:hypothetical protein
MSLLDKLALNMGLVKLQYLVGEKTDKATQSAELRAVKSFPRI